MLAATAVGIEVHDARRIALVNLPRHLFSAAIADLARKTGWPMR